MLPALAALTPAIAQTPREKWLEVADRLVTTSAAELAFDWGEGVEMCGLMQVYERTRTETYAGWVASWADFHVSQGTEHLLGNEPKSFQKGYCGHWVSGTALLYLYDARKQPQYLRSASEMAAFVRAGATRSPEGALGHWAGNFQIWVDTLNMACPLLSRLSSLEKKPAYIDDAVNQLLGAARHMRNEQTGLFHHMWDWQSGQRSPEQWGRGNGWVIMSIADTLEFLPKNHPEFREMEKLSVAYAAALLRAQDRDGLWHTIINDQTSPAECSASTMISYGLLKLVRLGILPAKYRAASLRSWNEVNRRWVKDGAVTGVSSGTGPYARSHYLDRPSGTFTWGTGAYLLAGAEVERLGRGKD